MVFKVKSAAKPTIVTDEPSIAYNTLGENSPLKKNRYPTDVFFISIFVLTFLSWLGCAVYVICFQAPSNINVTADTALIEFNNDVRKYDRIIDVICAILSSPNMAVLGFMFLAAGLMFLCIMLLKSPVSKAFVYTAVIGIGISVCLSFLSFGLNFIAIFMTLYSGFNSESYDITVLIINGTILTIQCIYQLTVFTCISKVGVNYLTEIIKESCRVLFYYCSLSVFASTLLIFHMLVLLLTVKVYVNLQMFDGMLICHFINIIGGTYMLLFITFFGTMVIAESIATWYWTMNKDTIPRLTVFRSVSSTTQNHLGTISYGATFIFPLIQGMYLSAKAKAPEENNDTAIIRFIAKIFLTFDVVDSALVQTAIHGHEFTKSAKRSFDLVLRNSSRYLAVLNTATCVIFIVLSIIATVVCIAMIAVLQPQIAQYKDLSPEQACMVLFSILVLVLIVILPYVLLMIVSIKTVLLCTFEDVLENNGSTEKPYYMNFKLQKMLTE